MVSRNASFPEGVVVRVLLAPLRLAFVSVLCIIGLLLAAWIVDGVYVFHVWPDGVAQLKSVLAADLARGIDLAYMQGVRPDLIPGTANLLYAVVFRWSGLHGMGIRFAEGAELSIPDTVVRNAYVAHQEAVEVALIGTQLFGVRLATIALMLPVPILAYSAGMVDGLVQRSIRRACGGRESSSLYHRAKHLQLGLLVTFVLVYLLWPPSPDPRGFGMPVSIGLGVLARMQWTYYKKHL